MVLTRCAQGWGARLEMLAARRRRWRVNGRTPRQISALTRRVLAGAGWLSGRDAA